jgi:hypothetical protein
MKPRSLSLTLAPGLAKFMRMRMFIVLVVLLAACSKKADDGNVGARSVAAVATAHKKGGYDGCALLSPAEIAEALGGTVTKGVPEPPGSLCRFKLSGETKFGPATDYEVEVSQFDYFQDRTSPNAKGIPMADVPELGPDAYLQGIGTLWSKAPDGSTILIHVDYNVFGGSTKRVLAAEAAFAQLGKTAAAHAH